MTQYRRLYVPGGTYFFTIVTHDRLPILTSDSARSFLRCAWKEEKQRRPFETVAICLLPDHFYFIISLPENDDNFSVRIKNIKSKFTRLYLKHGGVEAPITRSKIKKKERGVWQRRFWEHCIRNDEDFTNHLDYIHYNPVKHGLVTKPDLWPYSSFHRYVEMGWYDEEWGETHGCRMGHG